MPDLTLELLLGYVGAPVAALIGIPWSEAVVAGSFLGQKFVINEFVAYLNFAPYLGDAPAVVLSEKSKAICLPSVVCTQPEPQTSVRSLSLCFCTT